jgi:integrase
VRIPELRRFAPRNRAYVFIDGKRQYLGPWGSDQAEAAYRSFIRERFGVEVEPPAITLPFQPAPQRQCVVVERVEHLALAYELYARAYYVKGGSCTQAAFNVARVRRLLAAHRLDRERILDVNGQWLERFKARICTGYTLARPTVNEYLRIVIRMFIWGLAQGFVDPRVPPQLAAVPKVRKGRPPAYGLRPLREHRKRGGIPRDFIRRVRPFCPLTLRIMLNVQLATGMRPSELCHIRPMHLKPTREPRAMLYHVPPEANKTSHVEGAGGAGDRVVPIGPRSLRLLRAIWPDDPREYFFSPKREHARRMLARRQDRRTVMYPSHAPELRLTRKRRGGVRAITLGEHYTRDSYRRALTRACEAARASEIQSGVDPAAAVHTFGPYELRHMRACDIATREDLHVAKAVLGHASVQTTQLYVRARERGLIRAALKYG